MRPKIVVPTVLVAIAVLVTAIFIQKKQTPTPAVVPVVEATSPEAEPVTTPAVEPVAAQVPTNSNVARFKISGIVLK